MENCQAEGSRCRLRRAFLLVDTLHGIKRSDQEILRQFREYAIPHQIVLSKVDRVLFKKLPPSVTRLQRNADQLHAIVTDIRQKIQPGLGDGPEALGEIVTCSAEKTLAGTKLGVNNVRYAILAATGLEGPKKRILSSDVFMDDSGRKDGDLDETNNDRVDTDLDGGSSTNIKL